MKPQVLVCGLISADIIFHVADMPRVAEKYRARDVRFSLGGGGAIAAVALQNLGAQVKLCGRLGDDVFGRLMTGELAKRAIDCKYVTHTAGRKSSTSSVLIDLKGERQIVNYRDDPATHEQHGDSGAAAVLDLSQCCRQDAVLVDTRWEAAALQVLKLAASQGIPGVIDAEAPVSHEALVLATHIAFSRQGLRDYANTDSMEVGLRQAAEDFDGWVCVTDGARGVQYLDGESLQCVPAFHIQVLDTLGAGDVWHAAFTLQLAQGASERDAIVFANAAAALKCSSADGIDGAPGAEAVALLVENQSLSLY